MSKIAKKRFSLTGVQTKKFCSPHFFHFFFPFGASVVGRLQGVCKWGESLEALPTHGPDPTASGDDRVPGEADPGPAGNRSCGGGAGSRPHRRGGPGSGGRDQGSVGRPFGGGRFLDRSVLSPAAVHPPPLQSRCGRRRIPRARKVPLPATVNPTTLAAHTQIKERACGAKLYGEGGLKERGSNKLWKRPGRMQIHC